jgi:hypothetical protein
LSDLNCCVISTAISIFFCRRYQDNQRPGALQGPSVMLGPVTIPIHLLIKKYVYLALLPALYLDPSLIDQMIDNGSDILTVRAPVTKECWDLVNGHIIELGTK